MREGVVREAKRLFGEDIRENEPLSEHCSFQIGGPARLFLRARRPSALEQVLVFCGENSVPLFVLGRGTNVLVPDSGFDGMVISVEAKSMQFSGERIVAEAGVSLPKMVKTAIERGLAGLEFFAGIPGSVGGAAVMNAGAHGKWIGSLIHEVQAFAPTGQELLVARNSLSFGYRTSSLREFPGIVAAVTLAVEEGDAATTKKRMEEFLEMRRRTQPVGARCAGSVFKNPPGNSAGRLIELAGCKGMSRGGALVSRKHANFIVNRGGATYSDVKGLIAALKERVKNVHGVVLELEIVDLGEEASWAS